MEARTARIKQIVRVARMALDMAIGVGVARDIGVDCEAYHYAALFPSSSAEARFLSSSGEELFNDIKCSV